MTSMLEPRHIVHDSLEALLAPAVLGALLSAPVTRVARQPLDGHSGLAGSQLSYVHTDAGRLVLKRMSIHTDWVMFYTGDHRCRSVALWQHGLLDQVQPAMAHPILACARDGDGGWAMLMRDLTGGFFDRDHPLPAALVPDFLEALARLHAAFWNDPRLADPRLGLGDTVTLVGRLSTAQAHAGSAWGVLPGWIAEGWQALGELLPDDVYACMRSLMDDPRPLVEAVDRFPLTLVHGDYRQENLAHAEGLVVADWQGAARSLMTADLAWFATWTFWDDAAARERAIGAYRQSLEAALGRRLEDAEWQRMVALGSAVDALRSACFAAFFARHDDRPERRAANARMARWQGERVVEAAGLL